LLGQVILFRDENRILQINLQQASREQNDHVRVGRVAWFGKEMVSECGNNEKDPET